MNRQSKKISSYESYNKINYSESELKERRNKRLDLHKKKNTALFDEEAEQEQYIKMYLHR